MNSGLYALAGDSATATAAACANRFDEPMTNVSNMYFGLSRLPSPGLGVGRRSSRPVPALADGRSGIGGGGTSASCGTAGAGTGAGPAGYAGSPYRGGAPS